MICIIRKLQPTKSYPGRNGTWVKFFKDNTLAIQHLKDGDYLIRETDVLFKKPDSGLCIEWANQRIKDKTAIRV